MSDIEELESDSNNSPMDMTIGPSFNELFEDEDSAGTETKEEFEDIKTFKGPLVKNVFSEKYYQRVLHGEGDISQRLHTSLASFLKAKDPQDKTMYRGRLAPVVWDMMVQIGQKVGNALSIEKKFFLRYALLLPKLINKSQKESIASIIVDNKQGEPVHYMDEWLEMVALGEVTPLATDEEPVKGKKRGDAGARLLRDKIRGSLDGKIGNIRGFQKKRSALEKSIMNDLKTLANHTPHPSVSSIEMAYSVVQKNTLSELVNKGKQLQSLDREFSAAIQDIRAVQSKLDRAQERLDDEPTTSVNPGVLKKEVNNLRQIHKMCVGRQGNHFPILQGTYITSNFNDIATREQILKIMKYVEGIDPGAFRRTHRRQTHRIVPHVIIIPCYGDRGICWEPFEKFNRATSRGRIAVPLYPKSIKLAVITALAELRWEVAKAKAQYYWMEEGITGRYYQWFESRKLRGDVRLKFIEDYILWITKESEGTQKLDKEVRGIFWRNIPFPKELRDSLKNRGFVYSELYKKDTNRELSDGY